MMAMVTAHLCTWDGKNDNGDNREYDSNGDEDNLYLRGNLETLAKFSGLQMYITHICQFWLGL